MDHLPRPDGTDRYPYVIPLLCSTQYDNEGFADYPTRCGWNLNDLQNGKFETFTAEDLAPFLQTWLYFGLLAAVLNEHVDYNDFRDEHGNLSTRLLPRLMESWKPRIHLLDDDAKRAEQLRVYSCFNQSATVGRWLTKLDKEPPVPNEIVLSMQVLVFTLYGAAIWVFGTDLIGMATTIKAWSSSRLLILDLVRDGWCPAMLDAWVSRVATPALAYVRQLGRPDEADHSRCGRDEKLGRNVCVSGLNDPKNYRAKHTTEGCECYDLTVDQRKIADIVTKGDVPVLRFVNNEITVSTDESNAYVAISHVWRDGLGNTGHNSLPTCQLSMITAKVKEIGGNGFWIDTICVPAQRELKAMALKSMDQVYRKAQFVLVIDAYLRRSSCKHSDMENYFRVYISGWMERLWTYQEAALAGEGRLRVAFADGIISLDEKKLTQTLGLYWNATSWNEARNFIIFQAPYAHLILTRNLYSFSIEKPLITMMAWLASRGKAVSFPGDECIVFATLLSLDPGALYLLEPESRMQALLEQHDEWPQDFLFAQGPRLQTKGFRWAIASFLKSWPAASDPSGNIQIGRRIKDGLLLERRSFVFLPTKAEEMDQIMLCQDDVTLKWYRLRYASDYNPADTPSWSTLSPRKGHKTGLLYGPDRESDGTKWALLVNIDREEDGIIYATYGCQLSFLEIEKYDISPWDEILAPWNRPDEEKALEMNLWPEEDCWKVFGRLQECAKSQKWCIG